MGRYLGPKVRILRRLKSPSLYGFTAPKKMKPSPPGENKSKILRTPSLYALRLEEKQKLRFNYGLSNKQLKKYVLLSQRNVSPSGITLLQMLEMRLDATLFRLGFASNIPQARQWITHGHVFVNLYLVKSPSYPLVKGDVIHLNPLSLNVIKQSKAMLKYRLLNKSEYLSKLVQLNAIICLKEMKAYIRRIISPREISFKFNDQLINEYYA